MTPDSMDDAPESEIARRLAETRAVTLRLLDRVPDAFWNIRVHDFYSPIGWHFGHVGMTEEFWTWYQALGRDPGDSGLYFLFANLPDNSKDNRAAHLPSREQVVTYLETTRRRTLDALAAADLASSDPLLAGGYAWEFARLHECQHQETIAELLQLIGGESPPSPPSPLSHAAGEGEQATARTTPVASPTAGTPPLPQRRERGLGGEGGSLLIPGGTFLMGSNHPLLAYDNERPAHEVTVAPFRIDRDPVTQGDWRRFIEDSGYRRPQFWHPDGWAWRCAHEVEMPEYWQRTADGAYIYQTAAGPEPLRDDQPANALSWYEADAYARWAGKRLPTEAEWEFAAAFDPATGRTRRYPWGDAAPALDRADFGRPGGQPEPVGSYPDGASAFGIEGMSGGVWEWTSSPFLPYSGFRAFPYDGYSKEHMDGQHFVCKGGSWASAADIVRCAFRNWYVPTYRQGFLGLRCAADA